MKCFPYKQISFTDFIEWWTILDIEDLPMQKIDIYRLKLMIVISFFKFQI